jgi:hypothetical protein
VRRLGVQPTVANFASTKVGDSVALAVEDTRTFVLSPPGVATPTAGGSVTGAAVAAGPSTAGAAVSRSIENWTVVGVDPAKNTITLVNPSGGEVRTYDITSDAGRQQLPRVKRGDSLTEINHRIGVVSIKPKA